MSTVSLLNAKILTIFISNYHPQKPSCLSPLKVHKLLSWGDPNPPYLDRVQKACQRLHEDHILERPYHGGYRLTALSLEVAKGLVNRQLGLTTNVEVPPGGDRALRIDFAHLALEHKRIPPIYISGNQLERIRKHQLELGATWKERDRGRQLAIRQATFTITTGSNRAIRIVAREGSFMVDLDNFFIDCGLSDSDRVGIFESMEAVAVRNRVSVEAPIEGPMDIFPKGLRVVTSIAGEPVIETNINYSSGHPDLEIKGLQRPVEEFVKSLAVQQHYKMEEAIDRRMQQIFNEKLRMGQSVSSYIG